jgi:dihydrofolate reductase
VARLLYSAIASLDGYVVDAQGRFDWAVPDGEVHDFINELERPVGTYLYGRRIYEVMAGWDEPDAFADQSRPVRDFAALWRAADKVVYSRTLAEVTTGRTRLEREFDPDAVRALKAGSERDLSVGGPGLAGHALRAGLVDECRLFLAPVLVGGGTPVFPQDVRVDLDLVDTRRFSGGMVHLHYRPRG